MTFRLCLVATALLAAPVAIFVAALLVANRVNRRLTPARPTPLTLAAKYGWEMEGGDECWADDSERRDMYPGRLVDQGPDNGGGTAA